MRTFALLTLLMLTACASQVEPVAPQALPPFPTDRAAANLTQTTVDGNAATQRSPGAVDVGVSLSLPSTAGGSEWAVYEFAVPAGSELAKAEVNLAAGSTTAAWIGIANFDDNQWELSGPFSDAQVVSGGPGYVSPGNNIFVAVIAADGESAQIDLVGVLADASPPGWSTHIVADGPQSRSSLALVNGRPAIAFRWGGWFAYARANDSAGTSWPDPPVVIDTQNDPGYGCSLLVIDGVPCVSYVDGSGSSNNLWFARAQDPDGAAWNAPVLVTNPAGSNTSLAVVDGHPAIAHSSNSFGFLLFTRASAPDGATWNSPVDIEPFGVQGRASLKVVAGQPALAFSYLNTVFFRRSTTTDGSAWGSPKSLGGGFQPELLVVGGQPAICFSEQISGALQYSRALDVTGTDWPLPLTVDSAASGASSMALIDGLPAVAYESLVEEDLRYVRAVDALGEAWNLPQVLDSVGSVGTFPSLADLGGVAGASYTDSSQTDLMFMRQN